MKQILALLSLVTLSFWAQANDTFFSLGGSIPIQQFDRAGARFYVHRDLGRHLAIAAGYNQSESQQDVSRGSLISRFSMPFQTSLNERIYPFVGLDQQFEAGAIRPAVFFGAGIEQQWVDQWGAFLETRYQTNREQEWYLQIGLRFWPGRAKRLDARIRSSEPDIARNDAEFDGYIELSDVEQVQQPKPEPVPVRSEPETDRILSTMMDRAKRDLPDGVYVHLGFFRQVDSIQRYRNLITNYVWGDEILVHFDERLNGFRVLIGPYTESDARARRKDILEHDMDAYIFWVPEHSQ